MMIPPIDHDLKTIMSHIMTITKLNVTEDTTAGAFAQEADTKVTTQKTEVEADYTHIPIIIFTAYIHRFAFN